MEDIKGTVKASFQRCSHFKAGLLRYVRRYDVYQGERGGEAVRPCSCCVRKIKAMNVTYLPFMDQSFHLCPLTDPFAYICIAKAHQLGDGILAEPSALVMQN